MKRQNIKYNDKITKELIMWFGSRFIFIIYRNKRLKKAYIAKTKITKLI